MSNRIYMEVKIQNDSDAALTCFKKQLATASGWDGTWVPDSKVNAVILPGQSAEWRVEGELVAKPILGGAPISGAEARVWYRVGNTGGELYVHVNSPLVESQYGNTFHVWAPPGFEASHSGGQKGANNRARLTIRLRRSAKRTVPGFKPSVNGLHFSNHDWSPNLPAMTVGSLWNQLLARLGGKAANELGIGHVDDNWLPLTQASQGMCGGMVYTVMDYYYQRLLPPDQTTPPQSASDELFQFIRQRLLDSFDIFGTGFRWLAYSSPHYPSGDEGVLQTLGLARGRAWVSLREEWPKIRDDIDAGRLSPVGLVQTDSLDIGANHQVLGYAYKQSGQSVDLWIYNPTTPGDHIDDQVLRFDITDTTHAIRVQRLSGGEEIVNKRIYAILHLEGYQPKAAPRGHLPLPPHVVTLAAGTPSYRVVAGTATKEDQTPCKETVRWGLWQVTTAQTFEVQTSGFTRPGGGPLAVTWEVGGQKLNANAGKLQLGVGGRMHALDYAVGQSDLMLTLTSGSGASEDYEVSVKANVAEPDHSASGSASAAFDSAGLIDGLYPGDLEKWGRCLKRLVPDRADWNVFHMPGPDPKFNVGDWLARVRDHIDSVPDLKPDARAAVGKLVDLRAQQPGVQIPFASKAVDVSAPTLNVSRRFIR